MTDPAWAATPPIIAYKGIVYVQAAGATAAPGTADELGYVTSISESHEPTTTESQFINYSATMYTLGTYTHTAEIEIAYGQGAQTVRQLFLTAVANKTRVKVTIVAGETATGEKSVYDQCIVTYGRSGDPGDGWTGSISLASNSWTGTAATA